LEEVYKSLEKIGFFRSTSPADESGVKRAETVAQAG
jgi:hypothetical protein